MNHHNREYFQKAIVNYCVQVLVKSFQELKKTGDFRLDWQEDDFTEKLNTERETEMKRNRKLKKPEEGRKVVAISVRGPIYERLKAICVTESNRRGEPIPVSRYLRELIARTVAEADKQ